jgi:hypothetical protein
MLVLERIIPRTNQSWEEASRLEPEIEVSKIQVVDFGSYDTIKLCHTFKETADTSDDDDVDAAIFVLRVISNSGAYRPHLRDEIAPFLTHSSNRIVTEAKKAFQRLSIKDEQWARRLLPKRLMTVVASIGLILDDAAICRFQHPTAGYGTVEREFPLSDLRQKLFPDRKGAAPELDECDYFELEMEQDAGGHVVSYMPVPGSFSRGAGLRNTYEHPKLPANLKDKEAMATYDQQRRDVVLARIRAAKERHEKSSAK